MILAAGGGRDCPIGPIGWNALDEYSDSLAEKGTPVHVLKHGDQRGADRSAGAWARSRGIAEDPFPADWDRYGNAAGARRTAEMVASGVDYFVLFPGGKGTQITADIIERTPLHVRPGLLDHRRIPTCVPLGESDVRELVEAKCSPGTYTNLRGRTTGIGCGVAQVGWFDGAKLPDYAVYVGGDHHGRQASTLAMPCTKLGRGLSGEDVAAYLRGRFASDLGFRSIIKGLNSRSLLVCSCGSRACHAPVLSTAVLTMHCTAEIKKSGRKLPPKDENEAALVAWSKASLEAFSVCA